MSATVLPRPIPQENAIPSSKKESKSRSAWVDQLRLAMILLVVNMHACVTYSHVGSWYFMSKQEPSMATKLLFVMWQGHLQSFFMGLLFFIAGYYAQLSRARKSTGEFVKERLIRLGLPTLLFIFVVNPFTIYLLLVADKDPGFSYLRYVESGRFLSGTGPLWFADALLIFSLIFAALPAPKPIQQDLKMTPGTLAVLILGMALGSFLVRIWQPIGSSVLNLQFCIFTQYVTVFIAGIWLARSKGLEQLAASDLARKAGWIGLIGGPLLLIATYVVGGPIKDEANNPFFGGLHFQSLLTCFWEQFSGVCLGLGAISLAYRRFNQPGKLQEWLSGRAFGVYVFHTPVLVGFAILMSSIVLPPVVMMLILTAVGLAVAFVVAGVAAKIPYLRKIL